MTVKYLTMYKWDVLEDGTKEKFLGRLDALPWELSLKTKLGCADIMIPAKVKFELVKNRKRIVKLSFFLYNSV